MESKDFPGGTIIIPHSVMGYTQFNMSLMETKIPPGSIIRYGDHDEAILEAQGSWAWFLTEDLTWEPDLLLSLLSHNLDIVAPLVFESKTPFHPMAKESIDDQGEYVPVNLGRQTPKVIEVIATPAVGLLIKKDVFLDLKFPWFDQDEPGFCKRARREGYKVYVDLNLNMSHVGLHSLRPVFLKDQNTWAVQVNIGETGLIIPKEKIDE